MSREAFEAWGRKHGLMPVDLETEPDGSYATGIVDACWTAWSARDAEVDALKARVEELEGALRLILIQDQFRIVHPGDIEGTNHYNAFDVDVIINEALRDG